MFPDFVAAKDAFFTIRFGKNTRSCTHERNKSGVEELVSFKSCQSTTVRYIVNLNLKGFHF